MATEPPKEFDPVHFIRETRDRISEEIKDMSWPELRRSLDAQRPKDPFPAAAWDRAIGSRETAHRATAARAAERQGEGPRINGQANW